MENLKQALESVNLTSVFVSVANPSASYSYVMKNAAISSAFELKLSGSANVLNGGKTLSDVALNVAVAVGTFGLFDGLKNIGKEGVTNTMRLGDSMFNAGFSGTDKVYMDNARIWAGSHLFIMIGTMCCYNGPALGIATGIMNANK